MTIAPAEADRRPPVALWFTVAAFTAGVQAVVALFPLYEQATDLTTTDLTIVYGCYPIALIPAVLLQGSLSDAVGRRPLVLFGVAVQFIAALIGMEARTLPWLILARALQGWSIGALWATSTAWVRDFTPEHRRDDAARLVSATTMGSNAVGALTFGALGALTDSIRLPWAVLAGVLLVAGAAVLTIPETVPNRHWPGLSIRFRRPADAPHFTRFVAPLVVASMSMGTVALVMAPSVVDAASGPSAVWSGAGLALFLGGGALIQPFVTSRWAPRAVLAISAVAMPFGYVGLIGGSEMGSLTLALAGMLLTGTGVSLAFCALLILTERMSTPANRAAVVAAFSVILYLSQSSPALVAGVVADRFGLTTLLVVTGVVASTVIISVFRTPGVEPVDATAAGGHPAGGFGELNHHRRVGWRPSASATRGRRRRATRGR